MRISAASLLGLMLGFAVMADSASGDAMAWLTDMRNAVSHLNYRGVIAYLKDKKVESFQILHSTSASGERERLLAMDSPLREVVRSAEKMSCFFPEDKTVFVENKPTKHSVLLDLPDDLSTLGRYYQVKTRNQEYVARRLCQVIGIEPKDDFRYGRRVWIDTASKLPLKFELVGEDGEVAEQMVFTSVNVEESIAPSELDPTTPVDQFKWHINQRETLPLDHLSWMMESVPDGFQLTSYTRLKRPNTDRSVDHLLLSDGLSSVSIYIDSGKDEQGLSQKSKIGAINAYSRVVNQFTVTVMGEVPAKTVQAIADGMRYQDPEAR